MFDVCRVRRRFTWLNPVYLIDACSVDATSAKKGRLISVRWSCLVGWLYLRPNEIHLDSRLHVACARPARVDKLFVSL